MSAGIFVTVPSYGSPLNILRPSASIFSSVFGAVTRSVTDVLSAIFPNGYNGGTAVIRFSIYLF